MESRLLTNQVKISLTTSSKPGLIKAHDAWVMGYKTHQYQQHNGGRVDIQYVHTSSFIPMDAYSLIKRNPFTSPNFDNDIPNPLTLILVKSKIVMKS